MTLKNRENRQGGRDYLYERVAKDFSRAIREGVYGVHERMPSLRRVAQHFKVSLATAIMAYQQLEDEGLLQSRPKTGYFVLPWNRDARPVPPNSQPAVTPTSVNVGQLALSLIQENRASRLIKLGAAVPGPDMLPLSVLSRNLAGVARRHGAQSGSYEQAQGCLPLRRQIARLMRQAGCRCTPQDIVITNGCLEAMTLALKVVAGHGDTIAIESPTYFGILQAIESLGLKALEIATDPRHGIDLAALAKAIAKHNITACMLMPNFSNPLGSRMPDTHKKQLAALLAKHDITLIEDDVYGNLSYQQPRPKAVKAFDTTGRTLLCSSFSKTLAPGLRIGWVFSQHYRQALEYQKFLNNISTATLPQLALAEFLSRGGYGRTIRRCVQNYRIRMEQLIQWISCYFPTGTRLSQPDGGFIVWVALPEDIDCMVLYRQAMDKRIAISPGVLFGARGQYTHHIRLSCAAVDPLTAKQAIESLATLIQRQKHQTR